MIENGKEKEKIKNILLIYEDEMSQGSHFSLLLPLLFLSFWIFLSRAPLL